MSQQIDQLRLLQEEERAELNNIVAQCTHRDDALKQCIQTLLNESGAKMMKDANQKIATFDAFDFLCSFL